MANLTLFPQIIGKLDRGIFSKLVKEKDTDKYSKGFSSWNHLSSITNQMTWTANIISALYKFRWQIEIFFVLYQKPPSAILCPQ